jgi:hypothetical protein
MPMTLSGVVDGGTLRVEYSKVLTSLSQLQGVSLQLQVIRVGRQSSGATVKTTFLTHAIPVEALQTSGAFLTSPTVTQSLSLVLQNLPYISDLRIKMVEVRNAVSEIAEVDVLVADDSTQPPLPINPVRGLDENVPVQILPEQNIVSLNSDASPILDSKLEFPLESKITVGEEGEFVETFEHRIVENAAVNLLANPKFVEVETTGSLTSPKYYKIEAPGFIVFGQVLAGDLAGTKVWSTKLSNPNIFNAFDSFLVKSASATIVPGTPSLTWSVYYQLTCAEEYFLSVDVEFEFLDAAGSVVGVKTIPAPVLYGSTWHLLQASVSSVPVNAATVTVRAKAKGVGPEDVSLKLYLPKLEAGLQATTRSQDVHSDQVATEAEVNIRPPLFIRLKTAHSNLPTIRGLFDSTDALKDGLQFYVTADRLFLKRLSPTGSVVFNVYSSAFTLADGAEVAYGVYIESNLIRFYVNDTVVSSHVQAVTIDQDRKPRVGSLLMEGTALNAPVVEFSMTRVPPP